MGDPFTMALMAASAGINAYGAYQQGRMQQKAAEAESEQYDQMALDAKIDAQAVQNQIERDLQINKGQRRAAISAGGSFFSGSRSFLAGQAESSRRARMDKLTGRQKAASEILGYKQKGAQTRFAGRTALQSGKMGAVGSLVGGMAQVGQYQAKIGTPFFQGGGGPKYKKKTV